MVVGIGACDLDRLVPAGGLGAELRPPVELDEGRFVLVVEEPEGVDAEALDHPQRARDARSDMAHMIMCVDSGISPMKSQNVSCALAACG